MKGLTSFLLLTLFVVTRPDAAVQVIDSRTHHLGVPGKPEWDLFQDSAEDDQLHLTFEAHRNPREYTLFIRQDDVKQQWTISLNGKALGPLFLMEADLVHAVPVPPDTLRDGTNELFITLKAPDDILIRGVTMGDNSKENLLSAGPVIVTVRERGRAAPIPSRITVVNEAGTLVPLYDFGSTNLATRPGVLYTATGIARFKVAPGRYTIYASRGPEYTAAVKTGFNPEEDRSLELTLDRSADTQGWVASDTHIHSLTLSKHGDALLRERVITLAAEGIELPVSTEHNLNADYAPVVTALGLNRYFTLIPGNEVTTKKGHFNIFPVETNSPPPDASQESWPELLKEIRKSPGVKVVILNHPTDTHSDFTPFARTNLNPVTGRNIRGDFEFTFDAMELVNSGAMRTDWMEPFRAWFALLNRGYKITGVGASDSHDVSRFIVGQGRTYIRVNDADVSRINVEDACTALKAGHATVSLGLLAQLTILDGAEAAGPGDLLSTKGTQLQAKMTVDAPLAPNKSAHLILYANGVPIQQLSTGEVSGSHHEFVVTFPTPLHDAYYVLVATIDADLAPEWGLARPYQPTSPHFDLRLIGATNPIWIDVDGDGKFSCARDYAANLTSHSSAMPDLLNRLAGYDYSVSGQAAELLERSGKDIHSPEFRRLLSNAASPTQKAFADYQRSTEPSNRSVDGSSSR